MRRKFCQRLCIKLGIKCSKVAARGKHPTYEDVSMEQVSLFVRTAPARVGVGSSTGTNFLLMMVPCGARAMEMHGDPWNRTVL